MDFEWGLDVIFINSCEALEMNVPFNESDAVASSASSKSLHLVQFQLVLNANMHLA